MKCAPPFSLQDFQTFFGNLSLYRCARKLSLLWNYYAYTYSFLDNISPTVGEKNGHPLLGLSSKVFTSDHLLGHNVGLHFHEGVEKIKESYTNT